MSKNTAKQVEEITPENYAALALKVQQLQDQLEADATKLRKFQAEKESGISLSTTKYGALQMNGIRTRPPSFYACEWLQILEQSEQIRDYIKDHQIDGIADPPGPKGRGGDHRVMSKADSYTLFPQDVRQQK